jgi:general stress protein YciG
MQSVFIVEHQSLAFVDSTFAQSDAKTKMANNSDNTSNRGFASMDDDKQREIASKGGKASSGSFEEGGERASQAGRKGGNPASAETVRRRRCSQALHRLSSASSPRDPDDKPFGSGLVGTPPANSYSCDARAPARVFARRHSETLTACNPSAGTFLALSPSGFANQVSLPAQVVISTGQLRGMAWEIARSTSVGKRRPRLDTAPGLRHGLSP